MSRGFRSSLALIAAIAAAAYLYVRGRADASIDAGEREQLRQVAQVLAGSRAHVRRDSARLDTISAARTREGQARTAALRERAARTAETRRADSLLALGDTAAAVPSLLTALETARREIGNLEEAQVACNAAGRAAGAGWIDCRARRDSLEALLRSTAAALERRRSFRVLMFRLPRPPKVVAALAGCGLGAYLDVDDRLRGCGLGAGGGQLVIPTR